MTKPQTHKTPETTISSNAVTAAASSVTESSAAGIQQAATDAHTAPRFHLAFESIKDQLRAVPSAEYVPITIDVHSSVVTVLGALPHIEQLRADFVQHLPTFDITLLDFMETAAGALDYAQALYQIANEPLASIAELVQTVRHWHGVLYNDACTLMARGVLGATSLNDLKGANGNKNLAQDALALCALYRQHWATVSETTTFCLAELDEAQAATEALSVAVGIREQQPETAAQAVRDRQAAFTTFVNTYDEICAAVAYVRRKYGDADTIAPSLYLGRASKKKPDDANDANDTKNPTPVATAPAGTATATAPQPSTTATNTGQSAQSAYVSENGPFMHE